MRGKKIDSEFLCNFIVECASKELTSTEDVLNEAKNKINEIDEKIKEVESLKQIRSKLLDVVSSFDKSTKDKTNEAKMIQCFDIKDQNICRFICKLIKDNGTHISELKKSNYDWQDVLFYLKLLFTNNILYKSNDLIFKDKLFKDYMKVVLKENS